MVQSRYKLLVDAFAADIRSGRLSPGTRLPTHRQLAANEGLALVTASRVYAELEGMGLVSGETGRGTFVRETSLPPGLGIDQQAATAGLADLNFNYSSLPGQAELLRSALRQLASSPFATRITTAAQTLRILGEREKVSAMSAIREVQAAREAAFGGDITKARADAINAMKAEMRRVAPRIDALQSFLDAIKCEI